MRYPPPICTYMRSTSLPLRLYCRLRSSVDIHPHDPVRTIVVEWVRRIRFKISCRRKIAKRTIVDEFNGLRTRAVYVHRKIRHRTAVRFREGDEYDRACFYFQVISREISTFDHLCHCSCGC